MRKKSTITPYIFIIFLCILIFFLPENIKNSLRNKWTNLVNKKTTENISDIKSENLLLNEWFRATKFASALKHSDGIIGKIIYKDPFNDKNFVWINLGKDKIQINSPAIISGNLVGIVDFVGEKNSRVMLITNEKISIGLTTKINDDLLIKNKITDLINILKVNNRDKYKEIIEELNDLNQEIEITNSINSGLFYGGKDSYVLLENEAEKGQLIITRGFDGIYPSGIIIGKISEQLNSNSPMKKFSLIHEFSYDDIEFLWIIPPTKCD